MSKTQPPTKPTESNPASENIIYINYFDIIDHQRVKHLMSIITALIQNNRPTTLYFLFASNGGSVDAGIALYNFLKSVPVKVVMHNIGSIDSIANVIFTAGDERYAAPHSTFLFHGVTWSFDNQATLSLPQLEEIRDRINKNHATIAGIICENTKMDEAEIKNLFSQGETKDVNFALKKGVIHKIKAVEIPSDAPIISVDING